jgi:hypothetical protein
MAYHSEWRAELRWLVLTDEMLELPALVHPLAEGQRAMAQELRALVEAQRRTEESLRKLSKASSRPSSAPPWRTRPAASSAPSFRRSGERRSPPGRTVQPGTLWTVVEAQARLGHSQVRTWAQHMKSEGWRQHLAARQVPGPFLMCAVGIRLDRSATEEAERQGLDCSQDKENKWPPQDESTQRSNHRFLRDGKNYLHESKGF